MRLEREVSLANVASADLMKELEDKVVPGFGDMTEADLGMVGTADSVVGGRFVGAG